MIGVFLVACINFHLVRIHLFHFRRHAVPRGESRVAWREFRVGGNHAELFLPRERLFTQFVPALVEFAFVFVAPFLGHLMRRVACAGREIEKEGLIRRLRFLVSNPVDRVLNHRVVQIKIFLRRHADDFVVLGQQRIELTGFAAEKSPEIIEAQRVWPAVEGSCWSLLAVRCEMPFPDGGSVVTVALKNLRDGRRARRPVGAVARPAAGQLGDRTESDRMMVPPR